MVVDRRVGDLALEVVQQTLPPYLQTFTIQLQILELDIALEVEVVRVTTVAALVVLVKPAETQMAMLLAVTAEMERSG
jgi:hypothetical protein